MEILVFGDSIAYGAFDVEGGWVTRLRHTIDEKINAPDYGGYYHNVFNLGFDAENSMKVLARFENEVIARINRTKECAIIFAVGINDSQITIVDGAHRVAREDYAKNMAALFAKARAFTDRIATVGLYVVDDALVNPIPWSPDKAYRNADVREYNTTLREVAEQHGVTYIDVATPFIAAGGNALLDDGIHPTSDGHKVIYETVRDVLVAKGWI